ncbi:MAG: radical SAM protein [Anaerolineae bacterium]|nr:radical SAM protein [Anaerolineae bacterium]
MFKSGLSRSGFMPARVIQLHPSRFCNLACRHCYSASGPKVQGELNPETIISSLEILKAEGYEVISLSGGEPLLYSGFEKLVRHAASLGFQVNLITNGAPVGGRKLDLITEYVSTVAVSLDGGREIHNELRDDPRAFDWAEKAMDKLSAVSKRFGVAYCVSRESLSDMPWAVEFAQTKGAALIQFHPFAAIGRGLNVAQRFELAETDKARAVLIATLLDTGDAPAIHLDLASVEAARSRRGDYMILNVEDASQASLSDLVNPLIIDETGLMLPLSHGIDQQFAMGRIGPNLNSHLMHFKLIGWQSLRNVINTSFDQLEMHTPKFIDWFHHVVKTSNKLHVH